MKKNYKHIFLGILALSAMGSQAQAQVQGKMKVSAQVTAGCFITVNDLHFAFDPNPKSVSTIYHGSGVEVFDITEFLYIHMKCSKLTTFGISASHDKYATGSYVFDLKHTEDPKAPVLKYWLNNWGTDRLSPNIRKVTSDHTRTRLAINTNIQYQMLDGDEGFIRFAGQIEGNNLKKYVPGNYADTLNVALSY